jgi:hypothetical protein
LRYVPFRRRGFLPRRKQGNPNHHGPRRQEIGTGCGIQLAGSRAVKTTARWKSPLVAQGPRSGPAALPSARVLAAPQTGQSALGLAPHRPRFPRTYRPRRQNHGAVEKPPTIKIGGLESEPCATFPFGGAGSCRAANRVIRIIMGHALKNRGRATRYK